MVQTLEIIVLISSYFPQVTEESSGLQIRRLAAIILKKHTWPEAKAWSSIVWGLGKVQITGHHMKKNDSKYGTGPANWTVVLT